MTDRWVLKWDVHVDDREHQIGGGRIIHVARQHYDDVVTVWTIEPRRGAPPKRTVQVFGTGQPLPYFAEHLGTVVAAQGALVWHLFELPSTRTVRPDTDVTYEGIEDVELPGTSVVTDTADATTKVAP